MQEGSYAHQSWKMASRAFAIVACVALVGGFGCSQLNRFSQSIGYGYHDDFWRDMPAILVWSGGFLALSGILRWFSHLTRPR